MSDLMQQILQEFDSSFVHFLGDPTNHESMEIKEFIRKSCIRYAQGIVPKPMLHSESGDTISEKGMGYQKCIQDILCKLQEDTDSLSNK